MPTGTLRRVRAVVTGVAGSPYYMNGYFTADTGSTQNCIDAWADFLSVNLGASSAAFPTGATCTVEGEVQLINPTTGEAVGLETAAPYIITGIASGPYLPPANQVLVRWRTGNYVNGREVRGKTYIPCQPETNSTTTGQVETSAINSYQGVASDLISDVNTVFVVWSKKNGVWWAVQSASVWQEFAVLRSRRD